LLLREYKKKALIALLFVAVLVALTDQVSVHLFKNVFERLRPCHDEELIPWIHLVNNHCGGTYGFVSSHARFAFNAVSVACVGIAGLGIAGDVQQGLFRCALPAGCIGGSSRWCLFGLDNTESLFVYRKEMAVSVELIHVLC